MPQISGAGFQDDGSGVASQRGCSQVGGVQTESVSLQS